MNQQQPTSHAAPIAITAPRGWCFDPEDNGAPIATPAAPSAPEPAAAPVADGSSPAAQPGAPASSTSQQQDAPLSMAEALERHFARDERGRFTSPDGTTTPTTTPKPASAGQPAAAGQQPGQAPAAGEDGAAAGEEDDPTKMPEGLGAKAQERFRRLATERTQAVQRAETAERQVTYIRETFQEYGVRQDQFEQAVGVIGAINRGDFAAAQQILTEQLRTLATLTGQQVQIDALADFPDLRQKVDALQLSEADALETARLRKLHGARQQADQQFAQQRQQQEQQQRAVADAQREVDAFVRRMQASDMDFKAVEEQLLPVIPDLLRDVPPARWAAVIQRQYQLIKSTAARFSRPAPAAQPSSSSLRPEGPGTAQRQPGSMFEAMWGRAAPTA